MQPILLFFSILLCWLSGFKSENPLTLHARKEIKAPNGSWEDSTEILQWKPEETAIIICDMWDRHWCDGATQRVMQMAPRMNEVIKSAREKGITIIHAPSETMEYYKDFPQRKKMENAPEDNSSAGIKGWYYVDSAREAPLPVDDSDGGCDTNVQPENFKVWTRENPALQIAATDGISDNGKEINNYFVSKGIKNVILMGVHLNMCVLGRSFGVRGQRALGRNVVVVRDLTDAMYNPKMPPYVSHAEGVKLILQHIEKYWCPSIESNDLL